jgi:membrane glycosyltransferase
VLLRANALAEEGDDLAGDDPVEVLQAQPELREAHLSMLDGPVPRRRGEVDVDLVIALAKIEDAADLREATQLLTRKEMFTVLASRDALDRLFAKPPPPRARILYHEGGARN